MENDISATQEVNRTRRLSRHDGLESANLIEFHDDDTHHFKVLEEIGYGGEAQISEVEVQGPFEASPLTCVRRSIRVRRQTEIEKARMGLEQEVGILVKVQQQRHFIKILGHYSNGRELGILHHPRADYDLRFVLERPSDERQGLLSDCDMERGIGCLASALYFLHENKIRHKDICPANILVNNGQLLFADFGLSIDFSEMTDSETSGAVCQRRLYRPPESWHGLRHSCASDVFSMGCVFLEILAALAKQKGSGEEDIALPTPYRDNLKAVQRYIENAKNNLSERDGVKKFWLDVTQRMLAKDANRRPRMSNVILKLAEEYHKRSELFSTSACKDCMDANILQCSERRLEKLRNADFVWESDMDVLLGEEQPEWDDSSSGSSDGLISGIINRLSDSFADVSGPRRWYLTLYLDNGHSLKEYGTENTDVNLSFDFGELLVDRVVFEEGTHGKAVALYEGENCERRHFDSKKCDKRFPEGRLVRSYKVSEK